MNSYVVVKYEKVEVTRMTSRKKEYVPGQPWYASVVQASDEVEALEHVDEPGFFSVLLLPELPVHAAEICWKGVPDE